MAVEMGFNKSVVLSTFVRPTIDLVIPATVPVKVGDARGAFKAKSVLLDFASNAAWVANETGLFVSLVLSALPNPTIAAVIPETVPVKLGDANGAFKTKSVLLDFESSAVWVAVEMGFNKSVVLSTFDSPTMVAVIPDTVPVKVGDARGAFKAKSALLDFASRAV